MDLRVWVVGTAASGIGILKHSEPHDRLQGATNLQGDARSKPLKPGGTARAERMLSVAAWHRRERLVFGPGGTGSGRAELESMEGHL